MVVMFKPGGDDPPTKPAAVSSVMATAGTPRWQTVLDTVDTLRCFQSAQGIHRAITERGFSVGLSTVYRCLRALSARGMVDTLSTTGGETLYRRCGSNRHHHLVCRSCGRVVELEAAAVDEWTQQVRRVHGFVEVTRVLELSGVCPACAR